VSCVDRCLSPATVDGTPCMQPVAPGASWCRAGHPVRARLTGPAAADHCPAAGRLVPEVEPIGPPAAAGAP